VRSNQVYLSTFLPFWVTFFAGAISLQGFLRSIITSEMTGSQFNFVSTAASMMRHNATFPKDSNFVPPMKASSLAWIAAAQPQYGQHEAQSPTRSPSLPGDTEARSIPSMSEEELENENASLCNTMPMKVQLRSDFSLPPQHSDRVLQPRMEVSLEVALQAPTPAENGQQFPVLPPPGLAESLGLPSRGSVLHAHRACKPCGWFWKPQGCQNGAECGHCHLCPRGENRMRKKAKRSAVHQQLAATQMAPPMLQREASAEEEERHQLPLSCAASQSGGSSSHEDAPSCASAERTPSFSIGAVLHDFGECRPCAWYWKPSGCLNGQECQHCHMCARGEAKLRRGRSRTIAQAAAELRAEEDQILML